MSGIYWLASYPKSGNTWLRAFLTNYRRDGDEPANINELEGGWIAYSRMNLDDWLGFDSADLTPVELEHYQPLVYEQMAARSTEPLFIKNHSAFTYNSAGQPLFPKAATAGVIYLIRNPLDVAVSYAHHENVPIDNIIRSMGRYISLVSHSDRIYLTLPQKLLSWSRHVCSWVDEPDLNVYVARYEDMMRQPLQVFTEIVRFVGLAVDAGKVQKALDFSRFERLQAQEAAHGFAEKQPTAKSFFRQGRAGSWRESLTEAQVRRLVEDHGEVMRRFGYLGDNNEIVVQ